jgi:hypothetical protein
MDVYGYTYILTGSVVDTELFFSYPDPSPTFQLVSDADPTWIFSNILKINFTFVCMSCKCFRLHYDDIQAFRYIFLQKGIYNFKLSIFVARLSNFISNFRVVTVYYKFISDPVLFGSGLIFSGSSSGSC